jgi:hypothetical protein
MTALMKRGVNRGLLGSLRGPEPNGPSKDAIGKNWSLGFRGGLSFVSLFTK